MQWLPPQWEFLHDPARFKLLRLGNQWGGKTTAGLSEVDWRCTGKHPYLTTKAPPIEAWVICASWAQSVAIQKKYFDLCDKDALDARTIFDEVKGFKGKNPVVRYKNGSIVRFKTTKQGALNIAGATIDVVLIDEPTEQRVFEELRKRLMRRAGVMLMTLTPINGPTDYLRELAEAGKISDHHYPLRADFLIPVGAVDPLCLDDGTPMDQRWVEQVRAETLPLEAPVVVDGGWETRVEGRVFASFDTRKQGGEHITTKVPDAQVTLCIGVDHGAKDFKQIGLLVAVDDTGEYPRIHVLDEYVGGGATTPEEDAAGILTMLSRWNFHWRDVDVAYGDKPYDAGQRQGKMGRKSNEELMKAIAKATKVSRKALNPFIKQAKTGVGGGRGSIDRGCTWLHRAMLRPGHFTVQARCVRLIEALEKWDYTDSDFKDPIDALRYATWQWAMRGAATRERRGLYVY